MSASAQQPSGRPGSRWKAVVARWLKRGLALLALSATCKIVWVEVCRTRASELVDGRALPDLHARERYLVRRVLSPTFTTDDAGLPDEGQFAGDDQQRFI